MKYLFLALFAFACIAHSHAEKIYSINNGVWSQPEIWSSNTVPLLTDTVIVSHYIVFIDTLLIQPPGLLINDTCGLLCGDGHLKGPFVNYGRMYLGSFQATGPSYQRYGGIYCTYVVKPANGAFLSISGGVVKVAPNKEPCEMPRNTGTDCMATVIKEGGNEPDFKLYPNPANEQMFVELPDVLSEAKGRIVDATGRVLQTFTINSTTTDITVKDLPPGYYNIVVTTTDGRNATQRFVRMAD